MGKAIIVETPSRKTARVLNYYNSMTLYQDLIFDFKRLILLQGITQFILFLFDVELFLNNSAHLSNLSRIFFLDCVFQKKKKLWKMPSQEVTYCLWLPPFVMMNVHLFSFQ